MRIRGRRDLQAAIEDLAGQPGNDRELRAARLGVIGRARQLGAADLLPTEWDTSTGRTTPRPARNARGRRLRKGDSR